MSSDLLEGGAAATGGGGGGNPRDDEEYNANKRKFHDFLDDVNEVLSCEGIEVYSVGDKYTRRLQEVVDGKIPRLMVNLDDIRAFDVDLANEILKHPASLVPAFEAAALEAAMDMNPSTSKDSAVPIGFEGSFGRHRVSPRSLLSGLLGSLVCVEGIATKISIVHPKVKRTVHYCPATNKMMSREYRDATSMTGLPTGSVYPKQDDDGNLLETEFGLSTYSDHQTLSIQEMPEHAPLGQLPSSIDVILNDDLVDNCKPGDRVQIVGIFRGIGRQSKGLTSGLFKTVLVANSLNLLKDSAASDSAEDISQDDLEAIRSIGQREDAFELLSRSVAPSIFGHEFIKKAVLLQLLGGLEKNLENGTHIRGDINILMVGDPSTAKSQILRYVMQAANLAISTTGRGSSGVGLTAAVTSDPETREKRLEAGAMVLGDRGIVCIDEFDKMSELDRVAIHEVMEQQTVTIAKAGIHCSLNARCSVIAAANPICGQYDRDQTPQRNIGMPDSLLSRFDLLFIVLDDLDDEHNSKIAKHVLRLHRYQTPGSEGEPIPVGGRRGLDGSLVGGEEMSSGGTEEEGERKRTPVFEKFNPLLHGGVIDMADDNSGGRKHVPEILSFEFLKKYVRYAKHAVEPKLTKEACELISDAYTQLRQRNGKHTVPVTARQLETLIRISTAHAKARLKDVVDADDVEVARRILCFALFPYNDGEMPENEIGEEDEYDLSEEGAQQRKSDGGAFEIVASSKRKREDDVEDGSVDPTDRENIENRAPRKQQRTADVSSVPSGADLTAKFKEFMISRRPRDETALSATGLVDDFLRSLKLQASQELELRPEVSKVLTQLHEDNNIMLDGDEVYFI